jgi:hypothetical protein
LLRTSRGWRHAGRSKTKRRRRTSRPDCSGTSARRRISSAASSTSTAHIERDADYPLAWTGLADAVPGNRHFRAAGRRSTSFHKPRRPPSAR